MSTLNQNDLFVTAMAEYKVGEEAGNNGWASLIRCILSEFTGVLTHGEVKGFLKGQEKLYKENNVLPASYRSAKSTLLSGMEYGIPVVEGIGKSEMYERTKKAKEALASPKELTSYDAAKHVIVLKNIHEKLDSGGKEEVINLLCRTFNLTDVPF